MGKVIAMYDVRGIQRYIFRVPTVRDAMGASGIVENIINDALHYATKALPKMSGWQEECGFDAGKKEINEILFWKKVDASGEISPAKYEEKDDTDIQVLFIGGGNAFVMFVDQKLCLQINRIMSRYILEHTYSLQLATVFTEKSNNYAADYALLQRKMTDLKANMANNRPLGALPVMQAELKTGFPVIKDGKSTETLCKEQWKNSHPEQKQEKYFENLVAEKGKDSVLAVVHLDGNNMGARIRELIEGVTDYVAAVNLMRRISNNIYISYQKVFNDMKERFSRGKISVRKIIAAGDDITYVCTGNIALQSAKYFCEQISGYTLDGSEDIRNYGFSVCGGIAFINSHFPFSVGYDVAEKCCKNAKKRAKEPHNQEHFLNGGIQKIRIGNYLDFQICNNIQARNLKGMREEEYVTPTGEELLQRPYYVHTEHDGGLETEVAKQYDFRVFENAIISFLNWEKKDDTDGGGEIARSTLKELRNTYPLGKHAVKQLENFMKSRGRDKEMPAYEGDELMYKNIFEYKTNGEKEKKTVARWFDALEMMDLYCKDREVNSDAGK